MRTAESLLGLIALGLAPGVASGQTEPRPTVSALVKQQDTIIGIGELRSISYVAITDSRTWCASIVTSFPDVQTDGALLRNGFVTLREGTTLFNPPGEVLDEFFSISFANNGHLGMVLKTTGQNGAFWNLVPVALAGGAIVDPNVGNPTTWDRFNAIKLNTRNELFVMGDINNPDVPGNRESALIRYDLGPTGQVLSSQVLTTKGMLIDVLGTTLNGLGNTEHVLDVNNRGDFIVYVNGLGANAVLINMETVVAQELMPAPSPGRTWKGLTLTKVSINDRGDYIVTGSLDGQNDNYLVSKNGQKFAQAGDIIPSLSLTPMGNGTSAPVIVANNGDVFWSPRFDGANDESFARNYEPIIQRERTVVDGFLVSSITAGENGFAVSPNGRFLVGRVELQGLGSAALFVDFGLLLELPGCRGNAGTLQAAPTSAPRVGGHMALSLDNAQVAGAIPALVFSTEPAIAGSDCGIRTPFGEILFSQPHVRKVVVLQTPWNGAPVVASFNIPNNAALINATFFSQGVFFDPNVPSPEKIRFTNGMRIELGAP